VGNSLNNWFDSVLFACEVHGVVSMRLTRLVQGGPLAAVEANRMVAEKIYAFADAEWALVEALANGEGLLTAAERASVVVRRRVRANRNRLLNAAA
jgi:hypothetical protein